MIPTERSHLPVIARTHPGMKGKANEDRYGVSAFHLSERDATPSVFAIICDGIGGHRAGEVAAEMAVETITRAVAKSNAAHPTAILEEALGEASQMILQQAESNLDQKGMGATCVAAWIIGDRLFTTSVGDSRLYLIRGDSINQITTDHTWIQEALDYGALTPEQARNHPNAHVIRRYLGSQKPVVPDFRLKLSPNDTPEQAEANQGTRLFPGDFLLMCSDGLSDLVDKQEILQAIKSQQMDQALNSLIDLANQRGGHDNITVVALEMPAQPARLAAQPVTSAAPTVVSSPAQKRLVPTALSVVLVGLGLLGIGVVAVLSFAVIWYMNRPTATPGLRLTQTLIVEIPTDTATVTVTPTSTFTQLPSPTSSSTATVTSSLTPQSPKETATPSHTPQPPTATSTLASTHTPTITLPLLGVTLPSPSTTVQVPQP